MIVTPVRDATRVEAPIARRLIKIRARTVLVWGLVGAMALAGVWSVIYTTPWGTGTGWDQAMYIGAARNLLAGRGLTIAWTQDVGKPLSHFPPMYPAVLALLGLTGLDPWDGARYLNAALRGVDLVVVALLAMWASGGSRLAAVLAAFAMLASVHMEFVHGSAWSEPLFLVLALGALASAVRYITTGQRPALFAAGVLVAGAVLTRYAGLSLVPTIALALLLWGRARSVVLFVCIACAPLALWIVHNALLGGLLLGDRGIGLHDLSGQPLGKGLGTLVDWLVPTRLGFMLVSPEGDVRKPGLVFFAALGAGIVWWIWSHRRWLTERQIDSGAGVLTRVLLLFIVMYVAGVLVSMAAFDPLVQLDARILAPVFVCLVILLAATVAQKVPRVWRIAWFRVPVATLAAGLAIAYGVRFAALAHTAHTQGVIYANTDWLASATMAHVRDLPADTLVFSNAPDAVYILAGRSGYEIPDAGHADTFSGVLRQAVQTAGGPVVLVYFADPNIAYRNPVPATVVEEWLPTRLMASSPDGQVYGVDPAPGASTP